MPATIRMLNSPTEINLGSEFFKRVWGGVDDVVPADIAIATGHAGGYFSGAFAADGNLVGACYGFLGQTDGLRTLHSHVTASTKPGAGLLLKQHQRQWATERGIEAITWTFDPLVRRNCVFNLQKLGAQAVEYLVNFYGHMHDDINVGDESDRLLAMWILGDALVPPVEPSSAFLAIEVGPDSQPVVDLGYLAALHRKDVIAITLPDDIESLRKADLACAKLWRVAVREVLSACFDAGAVVRQMTSNREALLVEWPDRGVK